MQTSTTTQSAISGESFSDASRNMMRDIVVGALSNLAAQEIGRAVHGNTDDQGYVLNKDGSRSTFAGYEYQQIGKPTQLTLHAILGCGSAAAGGGDCASGAVAGVTGELAAEFADQQLGASRQQSIEFAGLAGGFSTIFTGNVVGLSDSEIAQNIYVGSRVGKNAAENNYLSPREKGGLVKELKECGDDSSCRNKVQAKYEKISEPREAKLLKAEITCDAYGIDCKVKKDFYNKDRIKITEEGNEYYRSLSNEEISDQFVELPYGKTIFHNYIQDPLTGEVINVLTGAQEGYTKYVHKTMGYEIVVDSSGKIVKDHLNMGTYNYYNPEIEGVESNPLINGDWNHAVYDVIPYIFNGNSNDDPSKIHQRMLRPGATLFINESNQNEK